MKELGGGIRQKRSNQRLFVSALVHLGFPPNLEMFGSNSNIFVYKKR